MRDTRSGRRTAFVATVAIVVAGLSTPHATAAVPECRGRPATIVGTIGRDRLAGTPGNDVIHAGPGNDVVRGKGGHDRICGGLGRDVLVGGSGDDVIIDRDTPAEALGDLLVWGGSGKDFIDTARRARVSGGPGADTLTAWAAYGDHGHDRIRAFQSEGGAGNDVLFGVGRYSRTGFASSPRGVRVLAERRLVFGHGRDRLRGVRYIDGSYHGDLFVGSEDADRFEGNKGDDVMFLGAGDDYGHGGNGNDVLRGGPGDDGLNGYAGDDLLLAGGGDDTITGERGDDRVLGGRGNDAVTGGSDESDPDVVRGGRGHDLVTGGDGNDSLQGGAGIDAAHFPMAFDGISANLESGVATGSGRDSMRSLEGLLGTPYGDTLVGDEDHNFFGSGGSIGGDDVVEGSRGDDLLLYDGHSTNLESRDFDGGTGSDWISFEFDRDATANWALGEGSESETFENLIAGPEGSDFHGTAGNNILVGSAADDRLDAGDALGDEGDDVLVGFGGSDECTGGERVHSCETSDGGGPVAGMERPGACALAAVRYVPFLEDAVGLDRFCRLL